MRVRERVHVMPVGYEYQRVIEPAEEFKADRVVLIEHEEDEEGSKGRDHWNDVLDYFKKSEIDYDTKECDIFDLYSSLGTIAETVSAHRDDDVYINVATGSKVTAIAGMIASMVLGATGYYVKANTYDEGTPKDISEFSNLPQYPIDAPDQQQVAILEFIETWTSHEGPPTKGETINFSEQRNLDYIARNVAGKGKYRLLDTHIVEPLKQRGWIEESKQGRNKVLSITSDGESALQAFRWMVNGGFEIDSYISQISEE